MNYTKYYAHQTKNNNDQAMSKNEKSLTETKNFEIFAVKVYGNPI